MGGSILEGYIIYYNKEKQRGAIYCKDNKAKYIFNATNMYDKNISVGDIVTFNIASKKNKDFFQLACNVTVKKKYEDSSDNQIRCLSCGKQIIPEIIKHSIEPVESICPFCGASCQLFYDLFEVNKRSKRLSRIIKIVIFTIILFITLFIALNLLIYF